MAGKRNVEPDQPGAPRKPIVVGVLSDTHGYLYAEVKGALQGVEHIIHAGDIGSPQVLADLRTIAPVTAVRGNCDLEKWAQALPLTTEVELGGARILVGHIASRLREVSRGDGVVAIVSGHSHMARLDEREGIVHLNPGSAGPRRFGRPRTVARLVITMTPDGSAPPRVNGEIVVVATG